MSFVRFRWRRPSATPALTSKDSRKRPGRNAKGDWQIVSDGAFEAMGTRLVRGRWFTAQRHDGERTGDVSSTKPWREPIGRMATPSAGGCGWATPCARGSTVVGIVADERHNGVTGIVKEKFYVPHSQWHVATGGSIIRNVFLVARTTGEPLSVAGPVRAEIRQMDANLPVANIRSMSEVVSTALATPRLTGFCSARLPRSRWRWRRLASTGCWRISCRSELMKSASDWRLAPIVAQVLVMVLKQGIVLAVIGIGVGLVAAFGLTRLMRSLLYQVTASDPITFVIVPIALLVVTLIASYLPALRATRVSPTMALRVQ